MKKILFYIVVGSAFLSSCTTTTPITKSVAYKGMYAEKPLTILLMPPINKSTNVEAKEYFHSTLSIPVANSGFYVIPTFLSMEILKKESAYDAELFLNSPLSKFGEVFGADLALFTIIHKWDKSGIAAKVYVDVEYIIKSVKTNDIIYTRRGDVTYDASISTGAGGLAGLVANIALSAINTSLTKYVDVARACNAYTFKDLPTGKYSPKHNIDGEELSGKKYFKAMLNKNYR
ncbi:MAG: GNA1162 family protein [Salinivirgaceae bacterium]